MHKALASSDVASEVVTYLEQGSLVALSQTCKLLSNIALDALWRNMTSLEPLYLTLPHGVWIRVQDGNVVSGTMLPQNPEDWTRFMLYAGRIRELSLMDDASGLQPDFLELLVHYSPSVPKPPLPRLQVLRVGGDRAPEDLALCLTTLVHSQLRALELETQSSTLVLSMLSHLQICCPSIQTLIITTWCGLLPAITRFTQLRKLVYDDSSTLLDSGAIKALAVSPFLRHLSISSSFTSDTFDLSAYQDVDGYFFSSLEEISFENVTSVPACAGLIRLVKSRTLRSITVRYTHSRQQPSKELRTLTESIALHPHLVSLSLRCEGPPADGVSTSDLLPLETLTRLESVRLDDVLPFVDPECCSLEFISKWPKLRTAYIDCYEWTSQGRRSGVFCTISHLRSIIIGCPRLRELRAAFIARELPSHPRYAGERSEGPLRITLATPVSEIDMEPYDVAEYLSNVRPNIEIACEEEGGGRWRRRRERWHEVNKWVGRINALRVAERQRVESETLEHR